ncbi:MAG TPA: protein translocase subunit SecF [Acidimicrobiia bacterium]|nr:protein translocase subunit SecF [Acidimicrobiia bacterium]
MPIKEVLADLFNERSKFDFMGRKRVFFAVSALAVLVGVVSLGTRQLNLGIDFEGGTVWQATMAEKEPSVADVREVMTDLGISNPKVTVGVTGDDEVVRVQAEVAEDAAKERVTDALADYAGISPDAVDFKDVGPTFGREVTDKALRALIVFLIAVSLYLALRFEWKIAVASLASLLHDLAITVGVYSLTGFEVTPATVIAVLTILGYSLYDNVVVFDKVKENVGALASTGRYTYSEIMNRSLNQVLMRSLNTAITTLIPVLALLVVGVGILGAVGIRDFALALFVGLLFGTYSSVFTAAPILVVLKEREARYRAIRHRIEAREGVGVASRTTVDRAARPTDRPVDAAGDAADEETPAEETSLERAEREVRARPSTSSLAPRGRQQRRRKRR